MPCKFSNRSHTLCNSCNKCNVYTNVSLFYWILLYLIYHMTHTEWGKERKGKSCFRLKDKTESLLPCCNKSPRMQWDNFLFLFIDFLSWADWIYPFSKIFKHPEASKGNVRKNTSHHLNTNVVLNFRNLKKILQKFPCICVSI